MAEGEQGRTHMGQTKAALGDAEMRVWGSALEEASGRLLQETIRGIEAGTQVLADRNRLMRRTLKVVDQEPDLGKRCSMLQKALSGGFSFLEEEPKG